MYTISPRAVGGFLDVVDIFLELWNGFPKDFQAQVETVM